MSNCPHCDRSLSSVKIEKVSGKVTMGTTWNCISYSCPSCNKVISVQIDPVAIYTDLVDQIKKRR
jgi:uncharacterized protein with PIN domain